MDIGLCVASHIGDLDYAVRAEELGFASLWFADSQMIWSDCYATLALAADRTSRIRIGTGVAVSGTRPAPVTAAAIATINAIAPGRTFLGIGAGNTAMRIMGRAPHRIAEFDAYLQTLKPLLRGEEARVRVGDEDLPIRHIMPDSGFVNFTDQIPLYVSGFGPRSLALAGRHGDGAIFGWPPNRQILERFLAMVQAGARDAGRELDGSAYRTTALTTISVLDPGETLDSPRVRAECGAMAIATLHYAYDSWRQLGQRPPRAVEDIWEDYRAMLDALPQERLHQRIHAGHNCWVLPEEERFVTPTLIENSCLVGTREAILERLHDYADAGLDELMILPAFAPRYDVIERVGRDLLPALARR
ncbi:MAG TPA: LLM class flavin-dependent oxidoreductase [Pseudomonadales bacterium]|nr:LLM class flavin-dependent oxidoreductase [Pseudomonadales bacterium]